MRTQKANSFHSESTVVAWPMNIFLLLKPERKCELFIMFRHNAGKIMTSKQNISSDSSSASGLGPCLQ